MRKIILLFLSSILISPINLLAKESKKESKYHFEETVHLSLPHLYLSKWQVGHQHIRKTGMATTRYMLSTESKDYWTQIVNIQFKDKAHLKVKTVEEAMNEEAKKSIWVNSKILSKKKNDVIYERDFPSGEHEIVRMIMTKKGLHRVAYIKKGPISQDDKKQWIERLTEAKVGGKKDKKE